MCSGRSPRSNKSTSFRVYIFDQEKERERRENEGCGKEKMRAVCVNVRGLRSLRSSLHICRRRRWRRRLANCSHPLFDSYYPFVRASFFLDFTPALFVSFSQVYSHFSDFCRHKTLPFHFHVTWDHLLELPILNGKLLFDISKLWQYWVDKINCFHLVYLSTG